MPETIKGLPIAAQTFPEIISRKQIYVDKTSWLAMMISDGPKAWLLARPRRFGKTLAVSAFEAIFPAKAISSRASTSGRGSEKKPSPPARSSG